MHWFYSQLEHASTSNSQDYQPLLGSRRGIPEEKLKILPRAAWIHEVVQSVETGRRQFWRARGLRDGEAGMLFVGRISRREESRYVRWLSTRRLAEWKTPVRPIFVGEGPYLAEMKRLLPDAIFTGYLRGEELASAYASADFFVFPSTTDTFGNVVS